MVDLHTHVLPGIDDGAEDAEVSRKLLEILSAQGVDSVVFTSHYYGRKRSPRQFLEARAAAFDSIKELVPPGMDVYLGAEVHFSGQMVVSNEAICPMAIGDTRYLLIELPFLSAWDSALYNRLRDFVSETDYVPVVAHAERYAEVQKSPAVLSALSDLGCLFQVNTSAFTGDESRLAFAMLKNGYVDCLGTDAHNLTDRAPCYTEAKSAVESAGYGEAFEKIQENMRLLLDDKPVGVERWKTIRKFFGRYR